MTDGPLNHIEQRQVQVLNEGAPATWLLTVGRANRELTLTLNAAHRTWTATSTDAFGALLELRQQLDPEGVRVCCNGARRNAWASGMQRDMGEGFSVYLLDQQEMRARPTAVKTLDPAPADQVVTVDEQRTFYVEWLARRTGHGE